MFGDNRDHVEPICVFNAGQLLTTLPDGRRLLYFVDQQLRELTRRRTAAGCFETERLNGLPHNLQRSLLRRGSRQLYTVKRYQHGVEVGSWSWIRSNGEGSGEGKGSGEGNGEGKGSGRIRSSL